MSNHRARLSVRLILSLCLLCAAGHAGIPGQSKGSSADQNRSSAGLSLIENKGQWPCDAQFVARLPDMLVRASRDSLGLQVFDRPGVATDGTYLRLVFEGVSANSTLVPEDRKLAQHSWFVGNDPDQWVRGLHEYGALRWKGLYDGIDLVLHDRRGGLEYDLELAPGVDVSQIRIHCEGQELLEIDSQGSLVLKTTTGLFTQAAPISFQRSTDGQLQPVACRFRQIDPATFGFDVDGRDLSAALLIDPSLTWSTFFGGGVTTLGSADRATSVDIDDAGDVYTTGFAAAADFPTTPGAYHFPSGAGRDCFAAKFRGTDGALIYSSVFGGRFTQSGQLSEDQAHAIRADRQGRAGVVGWTTSIDFPSTPGAYNPTYSSVTNVGFVLKLSENGDQLLWGTFIGGISGPQLTGLAFDSSGAPIVIGYVGSGYPTTPGAFDPTYNFDHDAVITKFDPTGSSLVWSTYLGGNFPDRPYAVEIDDQDVVTVAGETQSVDFPTTPGAYSTVFQGFPSQKDIFVTRFTPQGNALVWSTLYGGTATDTLFGMGLLADSSVVVSGATFSLNLPLTPGAVGTQLTGCYSARISGNGSSLIYSTYVGTGGIMDGRGVAVDASGVATVMAETSGTVPMTPGAFDTTPNGGLDVILFRLNPTGTRVYYSTYLGGSVENTPTGIATTAGGRVTVVGYTNSWDYPTTPGAYAPAINGGTDAFVTTFEAYLQGVELYGPGTATCHGPLVINATEMPQSPAPGFGFYLSGAPWSSRGLCLISTAPSPGGMPYFNATLWLNPASIVRRLPMITDSLGFAESALPIRPGLTGLELWAQCVMRNSSDCPTGGVVTSQALHLTVQ